MEPTLVTENVKGSDENQKDGNIEESKEVVIPPDEFVTKHPLHNKWTLWFYDHGRSKVWEENQRPVIDFDTIEDFWSLFNHIKAASELRQGCDYSLFKLNVRPMWEDAANRKGGRWLINLDKKQRNEELDKYWLELMLLMIGEGFDKNSDEICGAVINIRTKGDKIAVWTAEAHKSQAIVDIGTRLKTQLNIPDYPKMEYQAHKDTATKSGSMVKNLHVL